MGVVVYVAAQTEPVRRRVALKLIKGGTDSSELLGRFHSERQALALMSHPTSLDPRRRPSASSIRARSRVWRTW